MVHKHILRNVFLFIGADGRPIASTDIVYDEILKGMLLKEFII